MSEPYWIWVPAASACEACAALEGVHIDKPPRPHPHCLCTVARVDPSEIPGLCVWPEPLLLTSFELPGSAWLQDLELDYDENGRVVAATWIYRFEILCRDASTIEITKSYRDEDPAITQWLMESDSPMSFEDAITFEDKIMDTLTLEALQDAEHLCPACESEMPRFRRRRLTS